MCKSSLPWREVAGLGAEISRAAWVVRVRDALRHAEANYPFLAYGTDWLGFAHLVIAAAFVGPFRDPVKHRFIIDWGLFCCAAVIPLALIAGEVRGIPWWWRGIDCSFGVVGAVPLLVCRRIAGKLEQGEGSGAGLPRAGEEVL